MSKERKQLTPEDFAVNPDTRRAIQLSRNVRLFVADDFMKNGLVPERDGAIPVYLLEGYTVELGIPELRYFDHDKLVAYPVLSISDKQYFVLKRELE